MPFTELAPEAEGASALALALGSSEYPAMVQRRADGLCSSQ